ALGASYAALEEAKADVMGAYDVLYMIDRGELAASFRPELLVSYFAGLLRSTRFGVGEAHGKGAALQINRFLERGAVRFDGSTARFSVDLPGLERAITDLVRDICELQHRGDANEAAEMLARLGVLSPPIARALANVGDTPIDLRPIYPLAGEAG